MSLLKDRLSNPVHLGSLQEANGVGKIGNPACGDVVTIHVRIAGDVIQQARFETMGSAYQMASASVLCDCIMGQRIADARLRTPGCILEKIPDLPAKHRHLAQLSIDALMRALADFESGGQRAAGAPVPTWDESRARSFVMAILEYDREFSTQEITALVEAENGALPGSTLRYLTKLRKEGDVCGRLDVSRQAWTWCKSAQCAG